MGLGGIPRQHRVGDLRSVATLMAFEELTASAVDVEVSTPHPRR